MQSAAEKQDVADLQESCMYYGIRRDVAAKKTNKNMSKIKHGILGGFSGRVGNVVGSTWKGKNVMKIRPATVTNPNTERQQLQRARFSLVGRFNKAHGNLIRIGFRAYTKDMTAANAAMSYNLANAVAGEFPDLGIDFNMVRISMGNLAPLSGVSVLSDSQATVSLSWVDNSQAGNARESDQLMASLYDNATGEVTYFLGCASRNQLTATLNLPPDWSGRTVEVLAFLVSLEGTTAASARESVSNTVFAGSVEIL
jgi:hypothetical protein